MSVRTDLSGRGEFDIVDAQLHLSLALGAAEIGAAMDALGIRGIILDELWGRNDRNRGTPCAEFPDGGFRFMSPLSQAAALRNPERFSYLQRISRFDPDLASLIPVLAASPGCRALRVVIPDRAEREAFQAGAYDRLLGLAQEHGMPLNILTKDSGPLLDAAVGRYPRLAFVVDHCGWAKTPEAWNDVLALARWPNVHLKWSHARRGFGLPAFAGEPNGAPAATQREFLRAVDAFSAQRILWAGDVTHEESNATWAQLLGFVLDNPALSRDDKAWVLGKTARRVYGWDAARA